MAAGETRETVDMMAGLAVLVEQYLGKQSRAAVSGCLCALITKAGSTTSVYSCTVAQWAAGAVVDSRVYAETLMYCCCCCCCLLPDVPHVGLSAGDAARWRPQGVGQCHTCTR
jgi:hypothetical protein